MAKLPTARTLFLLSINALSALAALAVYSTSRQTTWLGSELNQVLPPLFEPIATWNALPSIAFVVWAWSLWRLLGRVNRTTWVVFIAIFSALEVAQHWFGGLTFDGWDLFAIILSGAVLYPMTSGSSRSYFPINALMLGSTVAVTAACVPPTFPPCQEGLVNREKCVVAEYEPWSTAKSDPTFARDMEPPMVDGGKLYLYQGRMFISQKEVGISVWSVSDPEQPEFEGLLSIIGNTDIAIRNGVLYANSYRDLVTVDLGDPDLVSSRVIDVFPDYEVDYELPTGYELQEEVDSSQGLLVGFTTLSGTKLDLDGNLLTDENGTDTQETTE